MTKHPGFSSATLWHQDIRYWLFDQPELVSVWLALGDETEHNGGLKLIPGSHRQDLDRGHYDAAFFLRSDLPKINDLFTALFRPIFPRGTRCFFTAEHFMPQGRIRVNR